MNKLQPSPLSSTRGTPLHQPIGPWGSPPANLDEVKFYRTWLVFDSECDPRLGKSRMNWNLIGGVALTILVSVSGWAGIAWCVARLWK